MATTFVDAVRNCLKAGGWAKKEDEREEGGTFLVGVNGRLFIVEEDYQVGASADGYAAVGCGGEIALSMAAATDSTGGNGPDGEHELGEHELGEHELGEHELGAAEGGSG